MERFQDDDSCHAEAREMSYDRHNLEQAINRKIIKIDTEPFGDVEQAVHIYLDDGKIIDIGTIGVELDIEYRERYDDDEDV